MAISCTYCGGRHQTPAEVKQCWRRRGGDDASRPTASAAQPAAPPQAPITAPARRPSTPTAPLVRGARPGPALLGRNVIVGPGMTAPSPWDQAARVTIDDDALQRPEDLLSELRDARHERRRLVFELATEFEYLPAGTSSAAPYQLGARFTFDLDELHHLVWSNALDARSDDGLRWSLLDQAAGLGATPVDDGAGDVVLPGGARAWLDGGPIGVLDPIDGVGVVHAAAVEHGSLDLPTGRAPAADLAPDQLAAVAHAGGTARIVAPAGSGKTRVLTERARHLLVDWRLPATAVCLVAFNKRAQEEMRERTIDLPGLQVRTLNSIALAIVNGTSPFAPQPRRWQTIDEPEVRRLLGGLVSFPKRRNSDPVAPWIEALSLIRLGLVDPDDAEARYGGDVEGLAAVWPRYREALEQRGLVDFDDQIHRALLVLLTDPVARAAAQRACRVLLVDEFQDLTPAHLLMVRLLSTPGGAVFGVGDDDQTIYGYNGADPAWLIEFADLFPGAGDHPLEVNYRCPEGVVEVADRLLRHNRRRVRKTIRAASSITGGWSVDDSVDPVAATRDAVSAAVERGAAPSEVAVLTRVNALLAPVQLALGEAGVPVSGGVGIEFVDRTAVRAVLAWVRLALVPEPSDGHAGFAAEDLLETLRRPSRSMHPRIADWVTEQRDVVGLFRLAGRLNNERDAERVAAFAADVQTLQRLVRGGAPTSDVVMALIDDIGLAGSVASLDTSRRGMNRSAQGDDLTAVVQLAAQHDDVATFEGWLRSALAARRSPDGVVLATVHRVKGQEWPHVVLHHAAADQFPHRLADDVEEERRLFHVALTRASRHVTVVAGRTPSPFVAELTTEPEHSPPVPAATSAERRATTPSGAAAAVDGLDPAARRRFEALRELRNELRDGKPAYVVFDNKTLAAIARTAPTSRQELARISGVGPAKLDHYGDAVVALMSALAQSELP